MDIRKLQRFKKVFISVMAGFCILSCTPNVSEGNKNPSLTERIASGGDSIDFTGVEFQEDAEIKKPATISNLDMGGNELSIKSGKVVLDGVKNATIVVESENDARQITMRNCENVTVKVKSENKVLIEGEDSDIAKLEIIDDKSDVEIANGSVDEVIVSAANGTLINGITIPTLTIKDGVVSLDLSGGTIEVVVCITGEDKNGNPIELPKLLLTGSVTIEEVSIEDNEGNEVSDVTVPYVKDDSGSANVPVEMEEITIVNVTRSEKCEAQSTYTAGETVVLRGFYVDVTYSDGSVSTVIVNKDLLSTTFNPKREGNYTMVVTGSYNETPITWEIEVTVTVSDYKHLLNEGIDLLFDGKYDEGLEKFEAAYNVEKNDETRLYYALTQIAMISVDKPVRDLVTNNFGFTEYPAKLNSLISDEWMKDEYNITRWSNNVVVRTRDKDYPEYIRVNLTGSGRSSDFYRIETDPDGYSYVGDRYGGDYWTSYVNYSIITPSENGDYLMRIWDFRNTSFYNSETDYSPFYYDIGGNVTDRVMKFVQFKMPEWLENSDTYQSSLFNNLKTDMSLLWTFLGNLTECNPNGLNELIDGVLAIFNERFETAKSICNNLNDASVELPYKLIEVLNLDSILGDEDDEEEFTLLVGKSELNVVLSVMEVLQGTFQWISSYDLSANTASIKNLFDYDENSMLNFFNNIAVPNTLKVRNASAMEKSRNSFISAANRILDAYEYLMSEKSQYPGFVKDTIGEYGDFIKLGVEDLIDKCKNGGVFYIPTSLEGSEWPQVWNQQKVIFGLDIGKLFTPGYFTDFVEVENGNINLYYTYRIYYYSYNNYGEAYIDDSYYCENPIKVPDNDFENFDFTVLDDEIGIKVEELKNEFDKYDRYSIDVSKGIGMKLNKNAWNDLVVSPDVSIPESVPVMIYLGSEHYSKY